MQLLLKKALDHFNAAIGIDNKNPSAHNGRANIFYLQLDHSSTQTYTISIPIVCVRNYLIRLPHIRSLQRDV
jgi:hypothetical protein